MKDGINLSLVEGFNYMVYAITRPAHAGLAYPIAEIVCKLISSKVTVNWGICDGYRHSSNHLITIAGKRLDGTGMVPA